MVPGTVSLLAGSRRLAYRDRPDRAGLFVLSGGIF